MCLAVPGKILSIEGEDLERRARIDYGGVIQKASLALVPEAGLGDYVIVHAGVAITRLDEREARRTLSALATLEAPGGESAEG